METDRPNKASLHLSRYIEVEEREQFRNEWFLRLRGDWTTTQRPPAIHHLDPQPVNQPRIVIFNRNNRLPAQANDLSDLFLDQPGLFTQRL